MPAGRVETDPQDALAMGVALRQALCRGELSLRYQPIIDIGAGQGDALIEAAEGTILAARLDTVEVLLRWHHPAFGEVPPGIFVPLGESLGLMQTLSLWTLERAVGELAPLLARHPNLRVAFNLSAAQVTPASLQALIGQLGALEPHRVIFEVTERVLLADTADTARTFALARTRGIKIALDDFGAGFASLDYLEHHPIDILKIDKRFVPRREAGAKGGRLAAAILAMAQALGVETVAEGIETPEQLAFYRGHGCRLVQGFLIARPLLAADLATFTARLIVEGRPAPAAPTAVRYLPEAYVERLEGFLATASDWFWEMDDRHVVTFVSEGARNTGFDPEALVGQTRWARVGVDAPEGHPDWQGHLADLEARRPFRDFVCPSARADGRLGSIQVSGDPMRDGSGRFFGYRGTARDVTIRVESLRLLAQSEARLADFLETASDWAWETDTEHRATWLSKGIRGGGVDSDKEIGLTRWELHGVADPRAHPEWRAHMADLDARRAFRGTVIPRRTIEGRSCNVEIAGKPVFDGSGGFLGYRGTARDVTARHDAEVARVQQTAHLELASQLAKLSYYHNDIATAQVFWSDGLHRMAGRDRATFHPDFGNRCDIYHQDDRPRMHAMLDAARLEGRDFEGRARLVRPDGEVRHIVNRGYARRDAAGQLLGFFGIFQDITDQVMTEAALEAKSRENELFRQMIESVPDLIFAKDLDGRFLHANAATLDDIGIGAEALRGLTDADLYPGDVAVSLRAEEHSVMAAGKAQEFVHENARLCGKVAVHAALKSPLRDGKGAVIGIVGIDRDITERVRLERALEQRDRENALYRQMINSLPDLLFAKDHDGHFIAANVATASLMGAGSVEALVGRTDFDFYPPEIAQQFRADELTFMARNGTTIMEQIGRDRDGSPMVLCSLKTPLRDPAGVVVGHVGHGRDITTLRQAEAAALRARATLESVAELFGDGVAVFDADNCLQLCNAAFARPYGALPAELIGQGLEAIMRRPGFRSQFQLDDPGFEELIEARLRAHRNADAEPVELYFGSICFLIRAHRLADGSTIIARTDITHLKVQEAELRRLATTDPLTGVANRRHLIEQAERAIGRCRYHGLPVALLLADLDRFKQINDMHGHAVGDRALQDFARIATAALRPGDLLARWGGEEFVVLLPGADQAVAAAIAERLRDAVARHALLIDCGSLRMTVSLGVAALGGNALGFDELASLADRALYRAKANGRDRVELADQARLAPAHPAEAALH